MDITALLGPSISALCAFGGSWLAFSTRLARVETKVDTLTDNVAKHNSMVERTYKLETRVDNLENIKIGGTK